MEVEQLTKQLSQNQIQLASAKDTLAMNQQILNDIQPLAKIGAFFDSIPEAATGSTHRSIGTRPTDPGTTSSQARNFGGEIKLSNTLALDRKDLQHKWLTTRNASPR